LDKLHKISAISALVFVNSLLLLIGAWYFLSYGYAQEQEAEVTFFEDMTGTIRNGTIWIKFNYTFTEPPQEEIDYTQEGIKFKNNGTVILR
jgi:hypothetical protein